MSARGKQPEARPAMARLVEPHRGLHLGDYEAVPSLNGAVRELRREAERLLPPLAGRQVWMINSTDRGGGVAELMPPILSMLRELGADVRWLVMEPAEPAFFKLTKRLHNLIHGQGDPRLADADRALYEAVSRAAADEIGPQIAPGDILVVQDPQPMGAGAILRRTHDVAAIWRCHIGLDRENAQTRAAWAFLAGDAQAYDAAIFTAPEYIPACLAGRSTIIHPGIDPLSHKNRELPIHKLVGILANSGLIQPSGPVLTPPFAEPAQRLQGDGRWARACEGEDFGLLFRPIVTQVSRWDRLKGFGPLMAGFAMLKDVQRVRARPHERDRRTLELVRLVLAGPDPTSIADDPEGREVLAELCDAYGRLPPDIRSEVAILTLPMGSSKCNALMVNALQRCSDVAAQNSLQEGFGLTATEAMWKRVAVMGTHAAGLRQQIRHGLDGWLVANPEDPDEIARTLADLLCDRHRREALAGSGQQRAHDNFLVFTQLRRLLEVLSDTARGRWA